jgi:MoaA/NifB/PqqE/SkfB family radical SAM enzyme
MNDLGERPRLDTTVAEPGEETVQTLDFVWLEITGSCQLTCVHCYAASSPQGSHGTMTFEDWTRVIDETADAGADMVQFIGGEPTVHPRLPDLIGHALGRGLDVEVFSNLYRITPAMWEVLTQPGVSLATSFYSDDAAEHDAIVARPGAHPRTTANIAEAVRRGIPLRTGVIDIRDGQRVPGALLQLERLGVTNVGTDRRRQVGRGERDRQASMDQLCGNCASGVLAIAPDGSVWPCVFTRWLPVGNVRQASLSDIIAGQDVAGVRADLAEHFARRGDISACRPDDCTPRCQPGCNPMCNPFCQPTCNPRCGPSCSPAKNCEPVQCGPKGNCWPKYPGCKPNTGRR